MAQFENETLGARFTVPDAITVRQQLAYFSARQAGAGADTFETHWRAAIPLLKDWQCEWLPDPAVDLGSLTDPRAAKAILWATARVASHLATLEAVPKN